MNKVMTMINKKSTKRNLNKCTKKSKKVNILRK